ncbi:MAG: hypothetical protein RR645_01505 [Clostridium sp.]
MLGNIFYITIIIGFFFSALFILYGYFTYKSEKKVNKKIPQICLTLGIITLVAYTYLTIMSTAYIGSFYLDASSGKVSMAKGISITGLRGSLGNGEPKGRGYPNDPKIEAILSKGDAVLVQNNIKGSIDEYKIGLKEEKYKDVFIDRIRYANDMKREYAYYLTGNRVLSQGKNDKAYEIFKRIKPSELSFYLDVQKKMAQISTQITVKQPSIEKGEKKP